MQLAEKHTLSEVDYLAFEESSQIRYEYIAGEVYAMAGGSQRHNKIAGNAYIALTLALKSKPYQVFMSDVKLHVAPDRAYYYPDVIATCTEQTVAANESPVVTNPVLVVEVLSPSTEATDRREKLHAYRRLPSLQENILVSQDMQQVEIYRRQGDVGWLYITHESGDTVEFASVSVTLPITELYAGTDVA
jgi:Uma2 family endonuclease